MMPGMIMLWHGTVATIPSGWAMCDGNNGTPDLRSKFIVCAQQDDFGVAKANLYGALVQSGGFQNHTHAFTGDGHSHDLPSGDEIPYTPPTGDAIHHTDTSPATGDTDSMYHIPPFYALCYIMKL